MSLSITWGGVHGYQDDADGARRTHQRSPPTLWCRHPGFYSGSRLRTLRRRVQVWRREAIQRLIYEVKDPTRDLTVTA